MIAVVIAGSLTKYEPYSDWTFCIINGFCGTLSTVSSWVVETVNLYETQPKVNAYVYYYGTLIAGVLLVLPFSL